MTTTGLFRSFKLAVQVLPCLLPGSLTDLRIKLERTQLPELSSLALLAFDNIDVALY